jgi:hypothetical protein
MPGGHLGLSIVAAIGWITLVIAIWLQDTSSRRGEHRHHASASLWAIPVSVALVTVVVILLGVPLSMRFSLSRPAFERLVAAPPPEDTAVGASLYEVLSVASTGYGYTFDISSDLTTVWGFAYSPGGRPEGPDIDSGPITHLNEGDIAYRHLEGPWYTFEFRYT